MTNHDTSTSTGTSSTMTPTDPRPLFEQAVATLLPVVDAITPDQLHLPTPCGAYDVDQLVGHLAFALDRVAGVGRGDELSMDDEVFTSSDWSHDIRRTSAAAITAWADDARLSASVDLPWRSMTGAEALGVYVNEVTAHTWDLVVATGHQAAWDDDVIAAAFTAIQRELPIADRTPMWEQFLAGIPEGAPFEPPFANAAEVGEGATAIERLVAWNGRRP